MLALAPPNFKPVFTCGLKYTLCMVYRKMPVQLLWMHGEASWKGMNRVPAGTDAGYPEGRSVWEMPYPGNGVGPRSR